MKENTMRILITGWFSFDGMGATAGDLLCRDLVAKWLHAEGLPYEVANASSFSGGVCWDELDPLSFTHVIFVCGPFGNGWPVTDLIKRFAHCRLVGLNLTMLDSLKIWNPFDLLLERDSDRAARPDMVFLTDPRRVPVVGVVLAHRQKEYGDRAQHEAANASIERLLARSEAAVVPIDTRLDEPNAGGLRTPAEIESLIARMDLVITTRLHGTVLALKSGIPALAIDPIAGGAKIRRQAEAIGWPLFYLVDDLTDGTLQDAFIYGLSQDARERARACRDAARQTLEAEIQPKLVETLTSVVPRSEA